MFKGLQYFRKLVDHQAVRAQFKAYHIDFKTSNWLLRQSYFPGSHYTELEGERSECVAVIERQVFKVYKMGDWTERCRKESEVDWVNFGATAQPGDSLFWEADEVFEANEREEVSGETEHASQAMSDTFQSFTTDVDLSGPEH